MGETRLEEGSDCPTGCGGTLDLVPCDACVEQGLLCDDCGWRLGDEIEVADG